MIPDEMQKSRVGERALQTERGRLCLELCSLCREEEAYRSSHFNCSALINPHGCNEGLSPELDGVDKTIIHTCWG